MSLFSIVRLLKGLSSRPAWAAYKIVELGDKWSRDEMNEFRDAAFRDLVHYCYNNVSYYRDVMDRQGAHPDDIRGIKDIAVFPVLTKEMVRTRGGDLKSREFERIKRSFRRSGGTTGEPIATFLDEKAAALEVFTYFRGLKWMGWSDGMELVKIFGGSLGQSTNKTIKERVLDIGVKSIYIPAFEINERSANDYLSHIARLRRPVIIGYASAVYNLAYYSRRLEIKISNVALAITTSELLLDEWRMVIQDTFSCPVRCYYGCGEVNSLGYQYDDGGGYMIPQEHVHIESIRSNEGGSCSLAITQLFNRAQPLIRYINGDEGVIGQGPIRAGFGNKEEIEKLLGRTADTFFRRDGTRVSPIFGTYSVQRTLVPVKKYQYVQRAIGEIEFLYETEHQDLLVEHTQQIRNVVSYVMQEDTPVKFVRTDQFISSPSGKHRITVCQLSSDRNVPL